MIGENMFEHYGFRDALCAVKKYLVYIVIAAVVFGAVGIGYAGMKNNEKQDDNNNVSENEINISVSELYFVSGTLDENSDITQIQYNREIALMLSSMLNTEYIRQTVFETLIDEMGIEDLIAGKASLKDKYTDKVITNGIVAEFVYIHVIDNTSILRIYVSSENEQLSERLLMLYKEQFSKTMETVKANNVECDCSVIADTKIGTENEAIANITVAGKVSVIKNAIIFAVAGMALSVAAVFVWTLFVPVINGRSDVEGYGTNVIVDSKETLDFAMNNIVNNVHDGKVSFVICRGKCDKRKGEAYYKMLSAKAADSDVDMRVCYNVSSDYDEFLRAKEAGRAIIAVSYSNTKHSEYQKTVARLRDNGIEIIGSVVV